MIKNSPYNLQSSQKVTNFVSPFPPELFYSIFKLQPNCNMLTDKTEPIVGRIKRYIADQNLLSPHNVSPRIGIALSGGADSVALLLVALKLGWLPLALHCNFHLRGEESNRDEQFVDALCQRLGVPLLKQHFDVRQLMELHPYKGKSVEMVCREVRYDWFRRTARLQQLAAVALGHHADDNIETAILNAIRGCGLKGVKGMPPQRDCYIRPLLCINKKEVIELIEDAGESYIVDSSNLQNDYQRNKIRNLILPEIERNFPGAAVRLARTVENLAEDYDLMQNYIVEKRHRYTVGDGKILVAELFSNEFGGELLLYHLLEGKLDRVQIANMHNNITNSGRIYHLSNGKALLLDRGILMPWTDKPQKTIPSTAPSPASEPLSTPPKPFYFKLPEIAGKLLHGVCNAVSLPLKDFGAKITVRLLRREDFHPRRDPSYAWFTASELSNLRWLGARHIQPGDRMQPFGMANTRLLSDICTDAKQSLADKERQSVIFVPKLSPQMMPIANPDSHEIIWLPGLKNSALYPVKPTDSYILEFHIDYL